MKIRKNMGFCLLSVTIFALCILFMSTSVCAATPRVMVSDYKIETGEVVAGEDFDLIIVLKNEAARAVKNLKLTISAENGELLPREGAGTAYVSELAAGAEEPISFRMFADFGLEEKSYKLNLKTEYEGSNGVEYTVEEAIFIPVKLDLRMSVTDTYMADTSYEIGETIEMTAVVNNLGTGTLYNVSAELVGRNFSDATSYVGNIESGKSGNLDILTKALAVTADNSAKNQLLINYENKEGKKFQEAIDVYQVFGDIRVTATVYDDFEKVKEAPDSSKTVKTVMLTLLVVVVIAVVLLLLIKRRRKKLAVLDEF